MTQSSNQPVPRAAWYCVRTQPKREAVAASQVEARGIEVFCPRVRFRRRTARGKVWFEEALFPGYLFARFDPLTMSRAVAGSIGVRGLIRFGGACAAVPNSMIDFLKSEADGTTIVPEPELRAGDEAVVAAGAMRGLRTLVTRVLPGGERVKILMDMMGTAVEAEVPVDALERVA